MSVSSANWTRLNTVSQLNMACSMSMKRKSCPASAIILTVLTDRASLIIGPETVPPDFSFSLSGFFCTSPSFAVQTRVDSHPVVRSALVCIADGVGGKVFDDGYERRVIEVAFAVCGERLEELIDDRSGRQWNT